MIGQFDALIAEGVEGSTFYAPVKTFPASIPAAEQARIKTAMLDVIAKEDLPAYVRFARFLEVTYVPAGRAKPASMPFQMEGSTTSF